MAFEYPARVRAALLPTRIERMTRYERTLPHGHKVWIKRDDETGFVLSGNKVRKLEFTFARALAAGVDEVVTCGGWNSNHCRATAFLARRLGLDVQLFLRTADGQPPSAWQGNLWLDSLVGAGIRWLSPQQYRARDEVLAAYVQERRESGVSSFLIPEGASDALGSMGYVLAADEIEQQSDSEGFRFDFVVHAMGSAGTAAGLSAGRDLRRANWEVVAFPVCDDAAYFRERIRRIRYAMEAFGVPPWDEGAGLRIVDGYQGRGYGLTTPDEQRWIQDLCRLEGILLDPCYTGKAMRGLDSELRTGNIRPGSSVLFLHTGGVFGSFAYDWPVADRVATS
ncbi:MAG: 1-aminocyclopropane-1-carboxylate deaminase/D-cysteine desulfhydrase [Planctomycetota bacterium]